MLFSRHWIFFRFMLPLLIAGTAEIPHFLMISREFMAVVVVALLFGSIILNLVAILAEQPQVWPRQRLKSFQRWEAARKACDFASICVLCITEIGTLATFDNPHPNQWEDILIACLLFCGPYAALVLLARFCLWRRYVVLTQEMLEKSPDWTKK